MLIFFIVGLAPLKATFPVMVAALASSTGAAAGVDAVAGASSFFGASEVSLLPHADKSSSEAAPQPIKNLFIILSLSLN